MAEFDDPYVLIYEKQLSNLPALLPLLEKVVQSGRPLVLIARTYKARCWRRSWSTGCAAA